MDCLWKRLFLSIIFIHKSNPKIRKESQQVSVAVGIEPHKGMEQPFIGLVYRTETEAKEEFNYFKSLNSNKFKDEENEIIVSYVFEDDKSIRCLFILI